MKRKLFMIVISMFTFLGVNSCKNVDMFMHPNNYIARDTPIEREFIHDTIRIGNIGGEVAEPVPGVRPNKQIVFTNIGQSFTFKSGESVEILADGIDLSTTTFDVETNEKTKEIKLTLVDKDASKVYISSENQVITRTGVDYVPKIELADGLKAEQIVVTPVYNDNCEKTGYEIRYGAKSDSELRNDKTYKKYIQCSGPKTITIKEKPTKDNSRCRLKRKLGLPCN